MDCINCGTPTDGNYCPQCGQRMKVKRISFKEGFQDFGARIYGFDSQFPRTLRDLTIRPGIAAKRFIEGNRALYYGPVGYYFLMITVMLLIASILGVDFNEMMMSRSKDLSMVEQPAGSGPAEATRRLQMMVLDNFKIFTFTLVLFVTLWQKVFFRKSGYNLLEHSVMVFFVMGHFYWLTILDLMISEATGLKMSYLFSLVVMVLFFSFATSQLYDYQSKVKAFVKGIFSFLIGYATFAIFIAVITLIIFLFDPEMMELMRKKG